MYLQPHTAGCILDDHEKGLEPDTPIHYTQMEKGAFLVPKVAMVKYLVMVESHWH